MSWAQSQWLHSWQLSKLQAIKTGSKKEHQFGWYHTKSENPLATHALNCYMCSADKFSLITFIANDNRNRSHKRLRIYQTAASYLLKMFAADQAVAEFNTGTPCYTQKDNLTPQQYADSLALTFHNIDDEYIGGTFNDVFMMGVDALISHSFRHCRAQISQSDSIISSFRNKSLQSVKHGTSLSTTKT